MRRIVFLALLASGTVAAPGAAQAPAEGDKLRVYMECDVPYCDSDVFRTEITFVDWVRDRADADVHILSTAQQTGGGGWEFVFHLLGRRRFEGERDTLAYTSRADDVTLTVQQHMARTIQVGLLPFAARMPSATRLRITLASQGDTPANTPAVGTVPASGTERDPWNFWVFRTRVSGNFSGEKQTSAASVSSSLNASRTTEAWKIRLSANGNFRRNRFDLTGGERFFDTTYSYGASGVIVNSLGARWASGLRASANSSTQTNQQVALRIAPAVEYNIYPYAESARRQLTIQYSVGVNSVDYREITIYEKLSERLTDEMVVVSLDVKQPWGTLNMSLEGAHYFHDLNKYRAVLFASGEVRLFRGFSLNLFGNVSRLRDQLFLPRGTLRDEDILLRRRQLETNYRYFTSVGITYRFGSIFDNVVNTRLDNAGGGQVFFFF